MKSRADARFRAEASRFRFLSSCEACAYFEPDSATCSHGYPNRAHREHVQLTEPELEFCKEFELD
jgi:hypothetical protein